MAHNWFIGLFSCALKVALYSRCTTLCVWTFAILNLPACAFCEEDVIAHDMKNTKDKVAKR